MSTDAVLPTLCYLMILHMVGGWTRSSGSWVSDAYAHCSCFRRLLLEIEHASQSLESCSTVVPDADKEVDVQKLDGSCRQVRQLRFDACPASARVGAFQQARRNASPHKYQHAQQG